MYTEKIGYNAGLIWKALEKGELSTKALKKATKLNEKELNFALGWLAREAKVSFREDEAELMVSLA